MEAKGGRLLPLLPVDDQNVTHKKSKAAEMTAGVQKTNKNTEVFKK